MAKKSETKIAEKDIKLSEIPIVENISNGKGILVNEKKDSEKTEEELTPFQKWYKEKLKALAEEQNWKLEDIEELEPTESDESEGWVKIEIYDQTWLILQTFEKAEAYAIKTVKEDLEDDPNLFSQDWLQNFITIDDVNKNNIATEESSNMWEESIKKDNSEVKKASKKFGLEDEFTHFVEGESLEEMEISEKDLKVKDEAEFWSKLEDFWREDFEKDLKDQLDDPVQYFVKDQGIYTREQLFKQPFITIDIEKASKDAVDTDGVAHFLARYDDQEHELGESYAYRQD